MGTADLRGARHEAVLYATPDDLAERLLPWLRPSLRGGGPVVAVLDAPTTAEVRRALGPDADAVEFQDPAAVHRVPAFTVAVRWARLSRRGGRAVVVGQHVADLCSETHWARLDIGLNVAVAGLPITVLCPYRVDGAGLDRVRATHPRLDAADSATYRAPHDAVVAYPPPPPDELGPPAVELAFGAAELAELRHLVAGAAPPATPPGRVADLVLAVNEIASNSVEHGPGHGRLRLWADAAGVTAEVADPGTADLPFPGMVAPPATGVRGRGLWLASELCDVLQVWSDAGGTVVRMRLDGPVSARPRP